MPNQETPIWQFLKITLPLSKNCQKLRLIAKNCVLLPNIKQLAGTRENLK
jgi:hypothetical protein